MLTIDYYFDENGTLLTWPSKRKREIQLRVLARLADSFEIGPEWTEQEINSLLKSRIAFPDHALIRRELIDAGLMRRSRDCRRYWREPSTARESPDDSGNH